MTFSVVNMAFVSLQSISYTDWLNSVVTSDSLGELILAVLPQICYTPQYIKRTLERRFVSTQQRSVSFPALMLIRCCKHTQEMLRLKYCIAVVTRSQQ